MDTFARDGLPPLEQWPDLSPIDYGEHLNAAVELLCHEGTAIASGWSYAELRERSEAIAGALHIEPGTRVLLHTSNTPEAIAAWLGILIAGGIVVATMPLLRAGEIDEVVAKARVTKALVARDLAREVHVEDALALEDLPTQGWFEPVDTRPDEVAIIAFTSGTTGVPKGCVHFHRDLLACRDTFAREILDPRPTDVFSGSPPIAFTFGLGASLLFPLRFGAATAPTSPPRLLETLHAQRVTTLFTAPTAYRALLRETLPDSLHTCVSAGEPLPAGVSDAWFEKTGIRIVDGIGSTELLHIFIASRAQEARAGSCGRPVPGYEARVVGPDMETLAPGEIGRLAVRGPTGCRYLDDARQTAYVREGWNLTGDAFTVDADGYFWFQARTDDMIISAGYNISGFEVEAVLLEHEDVAECAVVGVEDDERGHVVKAWVVPRAPVEAKALQDFVKARIAPYKYPRRVELVDALPRTPTGKIQRNVLRARG